jgi:uncharacterized repeat protein (TIGR03803 family)
MFKLTFTFIVILISVFSIAQPQIWGTTSQGGGINAGTIFKLDTAGNNYSLEYDWLNLNNGKKPLSGLIQATNNKLYGVAFQDGSNFGGVLFEYDATLNSYQKKHDFIDATGSFPEGELIQASNGKLYGLTGFGGAFNFGTLFEYDLNTSTYNSLTDFDYTVLGGSPHGKLLEAPNGKLYGLNSHGGTGGYGTLFEFDIITSTATTVVNLDSITNGYHPYGGLTLASNGSIYVLSYSGGISNKGVLFEFDYSTGTTVKHEDFIGGSNGAYPYGDLIEATNGKLYGLTYEGGVNNNGTLFEFDISLNALTKKIDFGGVTPGAHPKGTLVQSSNGKLYGYTSLGGASNKGIIFEYDILADTLIKKLDFNGTNGQYSAGNTLVEICLEPTLNISLNTNDTVCQNQIITLNAQGTNAVYTWDNGITNNNPFSPALGIITYVVSATNICGTTVDSIKITTNPSYTIYIYDSVCNGSNYIFPDGSVANNLLNDTIQTSALSSIYSCDSIVTTELHINPTYSTTDNYIICSGDSYTFADGFTQNNITSAFIHNNNFLTTELCDSLIQTTINVNPVYNLSESFYICSGNSYTFPDGFIASNITSTNSHNSNFQSILNCDSIITTTIYLHTVYNPSENIQLCSGDDYIFPDGFIELNITNPLSHISNLQSINGCDSIITTSILVNPVYSINAYDTICSGNNYIFPDGSTLTNINNDTTYTSSLVSVNSCDTVIITSITVSPKYTIFESDTVCLGSSYQFPDGSIINNISSTFNYTSSLFTDYYLCDSIINTTIYLNSIDNSVSQNGITLTSSFIGGTYQWLDCQNGFLSIPGETFQYFNPTVNGIYAVQLSDGLCNDTSNCFNINNISTGELFLDYKVKVYPNPTTNNALLEFSNPLIGSTITLRNILGEVIYKLDNQYGLEIPIKLDPYEKGIYLIEINNKSESYIIKIIKH